MFVADRVYNKVVDCYNALDSSCNDAYEATIVKVERTVKVMCTKKNMDGNDVGDDFGKCCMVETIVLI